MRLTRRGTAAAVRGALGVLSIGSIAKAHTITTYAAPSWSLARQFGGRAALAGVTVAAHGDFVYAGRGRLLLVVDVSSPGRKRPVGQRLLPEPIQALTVAGTTAYVVAGANLMVLDLANPTEPALQAELAAVGPLHGIVVREGIAALLGVLRDRPAGFLALVDVRSPASPRHLGHYVAEPVPVSQPSPAGPGWVQTTVLLGVELADDLAATTYASYAPNIRGGQGGLAIFDVRDPTHPRLTGHVAFGQQWETGGVALVNRRAYAAFSPWPGSGAPSSAFRAELRVVDATDADAPRQIGVASMPGTTAGQVAALGENGCVLVAGGEVLAVTDIRVPAAPRAVGAYEAASPIHAFAVSGAQLFVLTEADLQRVTLSAPFQPVIAGRYRFLAVSAGMPVRLAGTPHVWVADEHGVLHWASDLRALAGKTVDWPNQRDHSIDELRGLPIGDPWLSAPLLKRGETIYVPHWEPGVSVPTLLLVESPAHLALIGISAANYQTLVVEEALWRDRVGVAPEDLTEGPLSFEHKT